MLKSRVEEDAHCLRVMRYAERNPLRAKLVRNVARWRYSSLGRSQLGLPGLPLEAGPVAKPKDWLQWVQRPETEAELAALQRSLQRGVPYGSMAWQQKTAKNLGLESTLRPVGRPKLQEVTEKQ